MKYTQSVLILVLVIFCVIITSCEKDNDDTLVSNTISNNEATTQDTLGLFQQTTILDSQGNSYTIGFDQVSSINQNPYIRKSDASGNEIWRTTYEATPVDGRGTNIFIDDSDNLWATFTVDGGSNSNDYINSKEIEPLAFSDVYANSYAMGGGPKISVIAKINKINGKIIKGTFLRAQLNNGNTNSLNISKIGIKNGNLAVFVKSAAWPPGAGSNYVRFPDITDADRINNLFNMYYELNTNLTEISTAKIFLP